MNNDVYLSKVEKAVRSLRNTEQIVEELWMEPGRPAMDTEVDEVHGWVCAASYTLRQLAKEIEVRIKEQADENNH